MDVKWSIEQNRMLLQHGRKSIPFISHNYILFSHNSIVHSIVIAGYKL